MDVEPLEIAILVILYGRISVLGVLPWKLSIGVTMPGAIAVLIRLLGFRVKTLLFILSGDIALVVDSLIIILYPY